MSLPPLRLWSVEAETTAVFHLLRNVGSSIYLDQRDDGDPHWNVELRSNDGIRFAIQRDPEFSRYLNVWDTETTTGNGLPRGEQSGRYDRLPECV